jgi:putative addiction module component (TIGR02574 family)
MSDLRPDISDVLARAMQLTSRERGVLIGQLIESLDDHAEETGVEAAWVEEVKGRVDDIRSGKVEMVSGEQVLRELAQEFPDESSRFRFHP